MATWCELWDEGFRAPGVRATPLQVVAGFFLGERSVIDGVRAAAHDPALRSTVPSAYTDALHVAGLVALAVMAVVVVLVHRSTSGTAPETPSSTLSRQTITA